MFEDRARVPLILPQEVPDWARVFAMVLRRPHRRGLKRERYHAILANIGG